MGFELTGLPETWDVRRLEDCVEQRSVTYGIVQPGANDADGIPMLRVNNFSQDSLRLDEVLRVSPEVESKYLRTRLRGGEVLLTLVGSVGQVAIAPDCVQGWNVARAVGVMRPIGEIGARWLSICLRAPESQRILGLGANTTVQTTINLKDVKALPIPIPPKKERDAIEQVFSALYDKITLLRETNATLEAIAQAIFKSWFVDFDPVHAKAEGRDLEGVPQEVADLFPCEFEESELGAIPKGWRAMPFTEAINVIGGGTPKTSVEDYWNGDVPWFSVVDAPREDDIFVLDTEKHITHEGVANSSTRLLRPGTTIISARGTVGKTALVGREMAMNQSCYGLQGHLIGDAQTFFATRRLVSELRQRSHGSVFETVTRDTLGSVSVVSAPPKISNSFEGFVGTLLARVKNNVSEAGSLAKLRDTLLPRLMSGRLSIPVCREVLKT